MNPALLAQAVAVDSAALDAAASIAEEALACHREALILLAEGWQSETGSAIADFMDRQCGHGADVVDTLRRAAGRPDTLADSPADPDLGGFLPTDRTAGPPDSAPLIGDPVAAEPIAPAPAPAAAPAPAPMPPWTGPVPASPWGQPGTDAPWAAPASSGLAGPSAFPDLGATLAGLVAEITQALGSYADTAPSAEVPGDAAYQGADGPLSPDKRPEQPGDQDPAAMTTLTDSGAPATAPNAGPVAGPTSAPVPPPPEPVPPSPARLLNSQLYARFAQGHR